MWPFGALYFINLNLKKKKKSLCSAIALDLKKKQIVARCACF